MKKILLSIMTLGIVAAVAVYATQAYFSDTETSSGNTFTAGNLNLKVDSQCTYNGALSNECGTWDSKDLTTEKFFNFTDIKPGDWGENTVSLLVVDNSAWMCANVHVTQNSNLSNYLSVIWWIDDGDNILGANEKILYGGPRTLTEWLSLPGVTGNTLPLTFADAYLNWRTWPGTTPPNNDPIPGNETQYLGIGWCFGTLSLTPNTGVGFTCSGEGSQDDAQGTSVVADLTFNVEQYRNNSQFLCPEHEQLRPELFPN